MTKFSCKSLLGSGFPLLGLAAVLLGIAFWGPVAKQKITCKSNIQNLSVRPASAKLDARPKVDQIVGLPTPKEALDALAEFRSRYENDKASFVYEVGLMLAMFEKVQTSARFSDVKVKEGAVAQAKSAYIKAADSSDAQTLHTLAETYLTAAAALDKSWGSLIDEDIDRILQRRVTLSLYDEDAYLLTNDIDKMHGDSKAEMDELKSPLGSFRVILDDVTDARETAGLDHSDLLSEKSYDSPEAQASRHRDHLYKTVTNLEKLRRLAKVQ
jgi:hypothetical protein